MGNRQLKDGYIDLAELFHALISHVRVIVVTMLVCGLLGFGYSVFLETPLYCARSLMIVNAGKNAADYISYDQMASSVQLAKTCSIILTSDTVREEMIEELGMQENFDSVVEDISVASVHGTQIMQIEVTAASPSIALEVCEEITDIAPDAIMDAVEAGSVKLISKPSTTGEQVSPDVRKNTMMAGMIGLCAACGGIVLAALLNNRVQGEASLKQIGLPLLGIIPSFDLEEK